MKRLLIVTTLSVLFSISSFGQANEQRRFEIGWNVISYNRLGGTDWGGGTLDFAFHPTDRLAVVAELGVHERVNFFGPSYELTTYRFGPRFIRRSGKRLMMFAEALAGGARTSAKQTLFFVPPSTTTTTTTTSNGFAFGTGGGLDIGIRNWIAFRAVQAEYSFVHVNGESDNGLRVGIGFTFRFGK
jgi:outer membrane immunogenic protein